MQLNMQFYPYKEACYPEKIEMYDQYENINVPIRNLIINLICLS